MRHRYSSLIVTVGVLTTVAAGGGLTAWASWSTEGRSAATTARSGRVPVMDAPKAEISGNTPKISWTAVSLSATVAADGYVLFRIEGSERAEVCRTTAKSCRDAGAPNGSTLAYVVRATKEPRWIGDDSKPSNAVVMPGGKKSLAAAKATAMVSPSPEATAEQTAGAAPTPGKSPSQSAGPVQADPAGPGSARPEESAAGRTTEPSEPTGSDDVAPVVGKDTTSPGPDRQ